MIRSLIESFDFTKFPKSDSIHKVFKSLLVINCRQILLFGTNEYKSLSYEC